MLYRFAVTVPSGTPQASPVSHRLRLTYGVVEKVEVTFPAGCAGLVGVRILHREHVVWPTSPDEWFVSDDFTISFPEYFPIDEDPFELEVHAYNLDETYDHTIILRFAVTIPREDWLQTIASLLYQLTQQRHAWTTSKVSRLMEAIGTIDGNIYGLRQSDIQMLADYLHAILQRLEILTGQQGGGV